MASPVDRFEELRKLADRQRDEAAQREREEQARRHQVAMALPDSSLRYAALRQTEDRQREAVEAARQAAEAKAAADRNAAEQAKVDAAKVEQARQAQERSDAAALDMRKEATAKAEQDRQSAIVEQFAARSWKMARDASGPAAARADINELYNREVRRSVEERRVIEKNHPGNQQKIEQHDQFSDRKLEAIRFPAPHLQGKTAEQIKEIAQQALREELARENPPPARAQGQTLDHQAAQSRAAPTPNQDLTVAHEARVTAHNRAARTPPQPIQQQSNERAQLQPETARTDTRGLDRGDGRPTDRPAPRGEITDRKAAQQNENARPMTDRQARAEAARALAAQRGQDRDRGDDGGRGRGR